MPRSLDEKLQMEFQQQKELSAQIKATIQTLKVQKAENSNVLKQLDNLEDDAEIHKLVGPILIKQSRAVASANVSKRLTYISEALTRNVEADKEATQTLQRLTNEMLGTRG